MPKVLRFLKKAENDIGDIVSYIQNDNPTAAQRFRKALQETGELLLDMPHIGSMRVSDKLVLRRLPLITCSFRFHISAIFDFFSIANLSP